MFKTLKIALVSMLALATPALAEAPWELPAPKMSQGQRDGLVQLHKALANNKEDNGNFLFEYNFVHKAPIGNITNANIEKLVEGKYWVFSRKGITPTATNHIQVRYFSGGKIYNCDNVSSLRSKFSERAWKSETKTWQALGASSSFYLGGYADGKVTSKNQGWPVAYDPSTGDFALFTVDESKPKSKLSWDTIAGHLQTEYAAVFAEICPKLPNNGHINEAQTSTDYAEFRANVGDGLVKRAVPVIYNLNVRSPITLGMYYSAFPPKQ